MSPSRTSPATASDRAVALSVVICTHDRAGDVLENLDALMPQCAGRAVEVFVVDSASSPEHAQLLAGLEARPDLTLIRLDEPGLSLARNIGVEAARADWVAILDDDAVPRPGWVEAAFEAVTRCGPRAAILAGRVMPRWPDDADQLELPPSRLGPRARMLLSVLDEDGFRDVTDQPIGVGANMIFKRGPLAAVGGFDPAAGRVGSNLASGDEAQVMAALIAGGYQCWYSDAFVVDHKIHANRLSRAWLTQRARKEGEVELRGLKTPCRKIARTIKMLAATPILAMLQTLDRPEHEYYLRLNHNLGLLRKLFAQAYANGPED